MSAFSASPLIIIKWALATGRGVMFVLETHVLLPQAVTAFSLKLRFLSPNLVLVFGLFYMDRRVSA